MRQVFTSPRLENVERVAELLEAEGIEVRITNGRSYKGNVRANFSYRNIGKVPQPALWIIRSEDQPRARAMLRELGLMDSSRYLPGSFMANSFRGSDPYAASPTEKRAFRLKVGLLLGICVILAFALMHGARLEQAPAAPRVANPASDPVPAASLVVDADAAAPDMAPDPVAPTPGELAEVVFASGVRAGTAPVLCLALDGKDAQPELIKRLQRGVAGRELVAASACSPPAAPGQPGRHIASGGEAAFLEVGSFRPAAGADRGTVLRSHYGHRRPPDLDTLVVQRNGSAWSIGDAAP